MIILSSDKRQDISDFFQKNESKLSKAISIEDMLEALDKDYEDNKDSNVSYDIKSTGNADTPGETFDYDSFANHNALLLAKSSNYNGSGKAQVTPPKDVSGIHGSITKLLSRFSKKKSSAYFEAIPEQETVRVIDNDYYTEPERVVEPSSGFNFTSELTRYEEYAIYRFEYEVTRFNSDGDEDGSTYAVCMVYFLFE